MSDIIAAIEARLRDGLLTKVNRDEFAAAVPQPLRQRLAGIEPPKSACPEQLWWAFWRYAFAPGRMDALDQRSDYLSTAAVTSLSASALAHSAGPATVPISQPAGSTRSVVGIPAARPTILRSWNTLALGSA